MGRTTCSTLISRWSPPAGVCLQKNSPSRSRKLLSATVLGSTLAACLTASMLSSGHWTSVSSVADRSRGLVRVFYQVAADLLAHCVCVYFSKLGELSLPCWQAAWQYPPQKTPLPLFRPHPDPLECSRLLIIEILIGCFTHAGVSVSLSSSIPLL